MNLMRDSSVVELEPHKLHADGSIPSPATNFCGLRFCAWCGAFLGPVFSDDNSDGSAFVSHGLCSACHQEQLSQISRSADTGGRLLLPATGDLLDRSQLSAAGSKRKVNND